jgi:hypothetical protein
MPKYAHSHRAYYAFVIGLALMLAACGSKLTQNNIDKVDSGMSRQQVHALLGKPDETVTDDIGGLMKLTRETWKGRPGTLVITYSNDEVALKSQEPAAKDAGH